MTSMRVKQLLKKYPKSLHETIESIEDGLPWYEELRDELMDFSMHCDTADISYFIYMRDFLTYIINEQLEDN